MRDLRAIMLSATLLAVAASPTTAGPVRVLDVQLLDNGDLDGIADSGETLDLTLTVENIGMTALTGVVVSLEPTVETAHLGCAVGSWVAVGALAAGEIRTTPPGLTIAVPHSVERLDPSEPLTAFFDVSISSDQLVDTGAYRGMALELDLDVAGGATPTTFFEDFETAIDDLGSFVGMNLDAGEWGNPYQGASDGYRCQRSMPLCGASVCNFDPPVLGVSDPYTELFNWSIDGPDSDDGGRAFSGQRSLYMGRRLGSGQGHAVPLATLEAVRTGAPIHLGWDGPAPELSVTHQISLTDERFGNVPSGETIDRAVVQARLLDAAGQPAGDWRTIHAAANGYDATATNAFTNPMFDPIDDGSTEEDWFPGLGYDSPAAGPSSTCFPARVFAAVGDTDAPFDALRTGNAEGPGLLGSSGIGTWVESRFPLDRLRGRSVEIRFLLSSFKLGQFETMDEADPDPVDDGWWIDDVRVTGALETPATVMVDTNDNTGLPSHPDVDGDGIYDACDLCPDAAAAPQWDVDFDGFGNACDCTTDDPTVYPGAPELYDGVDNQCPGDRGFGEVDEIDGTIRFETATRLTWPPVVGATGYQVVRSVDRRMIGGCLCSPTPDAWLDDAEAPPAGGAFFYLSQIVEPTVGSIGAASDGSPRFGRCVVDICAP